MTRNTAPSDPLHATIATRKRKVHIATAGVVLAFAVTIPFLFVSSPIYWVESRIDQVASRGGLAGAPIGVAPRPSLEDLAESLQQEILAAYARKSGQAPGRSFYGMKTRFIMATRLQSQSSGALRITVRAYDRSENARLRDWDATVQLSAKVAKELVDLAGIIGEDLAGVRGCVRADST